MTHNHGRRDANHADVIKAVKGIGASVLDLADLGGGCPDVLVGFRGVNLLLEIKDGRKSPSARKLTPAEQKFFRDWRGTVYIVFSPEDAINIVNQMTLVFKPLAHKEQ